MYFNLEDNGTGKVVGKGVLITKEVPSGQPFFVDGNIRWPWVQLTKVGAIFRSLG